jgi:hypothetical protein
LVGWPQGSTNKLYHNIYSCPKINTHIHTLPPNNTIKVHPTQMSTSCSGFGQNQVEGLCGPPVLRVKRDAIGVRISMRCHKGHNGLVCVLGRQQS